MTAKLQRICMRLKTIVEDADKKVHSIHALYDRLNELTPAFGFPLSW